MSDQPQTSASSDETTTRRLGLIVGGVVAGFLVVALVITAIARLSSHGSSDAVASFDPHTSSVSQPHIAVPAVPESVRRSLPQVTTETTVAKADVDLTSVSGGAMVRIGTETVAFAKPGADPIAIIPATQIGEPTWLPVVQKQADWARVRLPSRPNGGTAWIPLGSFQQARTTWQVQIALGKGTMTVRRGDRTVGSWPIGQGTKANPTPVGETFVLAGFVDPAQDFSPYIYALGVHSDTLDTYGGGPGTVAVHGWPTAAGRTGKVSHGCVRVPDGALDLFAEIPKGTPVNITA